jgi:hypothetical protein
MEYCENSNLNCIIETLKKIDVHFQEDVYFLILNNIYLFLFVYFI